MEAVISSRGGGAVMRCDAWSPRAAPGRYTIWDGQERREERGVHSLELISDM